MMPEDEAGLAEVIEVESGLLTNIQDSVFHSSKILHMINLSVKKGRTLFLLKKKAVKRKSGVKRKRYELESDPIASNEEERKKKRLKV